MLAAFIIGLNIYSPALSAPFVFDDFNLPYQREFPTGILAWISGVRPFLMFTYWLNSRISGDSSLGYHLFNLLIHSINTGLVFLVLHKLLTLFGRLDERAVRIASITGAAVFLVHPLQTESVSYVAGRSESLAAMFMLLGYVVYLYRRGEGISWAESAAVLILFALGFSTKENAVSLAGMLILTDLFSPRPFSIQGFRNNFRLYVPLALGMVVVVWKVSRVLATAHSAGFSFSNITWYQYGFTQARAIFTYLRLAVLPVGQSIDHDYPISQSILQYGAIFYLFALVAVTVVFVLWRKRYPLACFGWLLTLILLAPTSSIVPINDPLVERRMYLPLLGLILIGCEVATHLKMRQVTGYAICSAILILLSVVCYQRNLLWAQPSQLWAQAAVESPAKGRAYANLVDQLVQERQCAAAIPYLQRAEQILPDNYHVEVAWGRTLECLGHPDQALPKLLRAAQIWPTSDVYRLIGLLYGELSRPAEAGIALHQAVRLDPTSEPARGALAKWVAWTKDIEAQKKQQSAVPPQSIAK
jgi:tetratricopeptide (TPR) repeat protein